MSSHEKLRSGSGVMSIEYELPPDIQAIEDEVNASPIAEKSVLIEAYTKIGTGAEHAARLGLSRTEFYTRRKQAELRLAARI